MIGQGSQILDAEIKRSVIGRNVRIEPGTKIEECIILDGSIVGAKSHLRRVVADRFNVIPAGSEMGLSPTEDRKRYHVSRSNLVVLPRQFRGISHDRPRKSRAQEGAS